MLTFILAMALMTAGQQPPAAAVCVQSWQKGNTQVSEQTLTLALGPRQQTYQTTILDAEGRSRFTLELRHHPAGQEYYEMEYWTAHLNEVSRQTALTDRVGGENLLLAARPGPGKDYFPKEDLVAFLYPKERPKRLLERYYPISAERVVRVEGFYVRIKAGDYQYDPRNPKLILSMSVTVEFRNNDDRCNFSPQS